MVQITSDLKLGNKGNRKRESYRVVYYVARNARDKMETVLRTAVHKQQQDQLCSLNIQMENDVGHVAVDLHRKERLLRKVYRMMSEDW